MAGIDTIRIAELSASEYEATIPGLAALLVDAVDSGASVNFLAGLDEATAAGWWRDRVTGVGDGTISPFIAFDGDRVVGSVLLIRSRNPNSLHRAEIAKVIVHRSVRRRGLAAALMTAAETRAASEGRWLLFLDTETGSGAEAFYRSLGWSEAGTIPNYALLTDGTLSPATWYWKDLR
jgi:GNAT superfamily N-acetyltransferase